MSRPMKESGVQWIGMVPKEWNIHRLKSCVSDRESGAWGNDIAGDDGDVVCLRIADFDYRRYRFKELDNPVRRNYDKSTINRLALKKGDLLVEKSGGGDKTPVGRMVMFDKDYTALYANFMDRLRCRNFVNPNWFLYLWNTFYANGYVWNYIKQTTGLQNYDMTSMLTEEKLALPSLPEQQRIASFLDCKCAAIDDVLTKTQESIEEYKKLKQAVITEAVTKGVRGKRPMKDSGVNWIGQIPKDWNVDKLKRILTERNESNDPVQTSERLSLSIDTGVTLYAEKTTNLDRFKEDVSQYKLAHIGDLVMNSMNVIVGAVGVSDYFGCVSPAYYTYYDNEEDHITARYMDYVFRTKSLRTLLYRLGKGIYAIDRGDGKVNTCRLKVSREDMRSLLLPLPSVEEQREIVSYLDKKREDIEALIAKKQQFIDELTAYKKSLIYEYVTGKREVPV